MEVHGHKCGKVLNMDVPEYLRQPLHIDTNIVYDLDTTLFPGMDDPRYMYEPALLIADQYPDDDVNVDVTTTEFENPIIDTIPDTEICQSPLIDLNIHVDCALDSETFQFLLDDVINSSSTVTPDGSAVCSDSSCTSFVPHSHRLPSITSFLKDSKIDQLRNCDQSPKICEEALCTTRKRRLSRDYENLELPEVTKRVKNTSPLLSCATSFSVNTKHMGMNRGS